MFIVISNSKYRNIGAEIIKDVKLKRYKFGVIWDLYRLV